VLGPAIEEHFRRAMLLSRGSPSVFFTSPLSAVLLFMTFLAILAIAIPQIRSKRDVLKE
jgi:putative tricarboxylic transport membrane protein